MVPLHVNSLLFLFFSFAVAFYSLFSFTMQHNEQEKAFGIGWRAFESLSQGTEITI